ncbi:MAG: hypothetical protein CMK07_09590 [Ponticaulis sp.]|nr:hypothetical protein [Ponticaulis sp.]
MLISACGEPAQLENSPDEYVYLRAGYDFHSGHPEKNRMANEKLLGMFERVEQNKDKYVSDGLRGIIYPAVDHEYFELVFQGDCEAARAFFRTLARSVANYLSEDGIVCSNDIRTSSWEMAGE